MLLLLLLLLGVPYLSVLSPSGSTLGGQGLTRTSLTLFPLSLPLGPVSITKSKSKEKVDESKLKNKMYLAVKGSLFPIQPQEPLYSTNSMSITEKEIESDEEMSAVGSTDVYLDSTEGKKHGEAYHRNNWKKRVDEEKRREDRLYKEGLSNFLNSERIKEIEIEGTEIDSSVPTSAAATRVMLLNGHGLEPLQCIFMICNNSSALEG